MKRLIEWDPEQRLATWFHKDPATGVCAIEEIQDVAPYIERNKAIQNMHAGGAKGLTEYSRRGIKNGWWHIGTIPVGVQLKWLREYGVNIYNKDHTAKVKRLLNDPEWRYLRTGLGRV